MKLFILLICLSLSLIGDKTCKSKKEYPKSERYGNRQELKTDAARSFKMEYEILMNSCSKDQNCIVIVFCDPAFFNEEDMKNIVEEFSADFSDKRVVNLSLFDDEDIAKAYAAGTRNLGNLQNERRGWYVRTEDTEFLLFFPDSDRRGKQLVVKPTNSDDNPVKDKLPTTVGTP